MDKKNIHNNFAEFLDQNTIPEKITREFLEQNHPENLPVLITDFVLKKLKSIPKQDRAKSLQNLPKGIRIIYLLVRYEDSVNQKGFMETFKEFHESGSYLLTELFVALKLVGASRSLKITKRAFKIFFGIRSPVFFESRYYGKPASVYTERKIKKLKKLEELFYIKSTDLGICEVNFITNNKELFIGL